MHRLSLLDCSCLTISHVLRHCDLLVLHLTLHLISLLLIALLCGLVLLLSAILLFVIVFTVSTARLIWSALAIFDHLLLAVVSSHLLLIVLFVVITTFILIPVIVFRLLRLLLFDLLLSLLFLGLGFLRIILIIQSSNVLLESNLSNAWLLRNYLTLCTVNHDLGLFGFFLLENMLCNLDDLGLRSDHILSRVNVVQTFDFLLNDLKKFLKIGSLIFTLNHADLMFLFLYN